MHLNEGYPGIIGHFCSKVTHSTLHSPYILIYWPLTSHLPSYVLTYPPTSYFPPLVLHLYIPTYHPMSLHIHLPPISHLPSYILTYLPTSYFPPTYLPTYSATYLPPMDYNLPTNYLTFLLIYITNDVKWTNEIKNTTNFVNFGK
jgi:hypothetical protein